MLHIGFKSTTGLYKIKLLTGARNIPIDISRIVNLWHYTRANITVTDDQVFARKSRDEILDQPQFSYPHNREKMPQWPPDMRIKITYDVRACMICVTFESREC